MMKTFLHVTEALRVRDCNQNPARVYFRTLTEADDGYTVRTVTADAFWNAVLKAAKTLSEMGLSNKHIALTGQSSAAFLAAFAAVQYVGGVAVLLDAQLSAEALSARATFADAACILCDETTADTVSQTGFPHAPFPAISDDAAEFHSPVTFPLPEAEGSAPACILYTSGTTAVSAVGKAVVLSSHATASGICHNVIGQPFSVQLTVMPFHHIGGIASVWNTLYLERTVATAEDLKHLFRYLSYLQPDYVLCVPSVLQMLLARLEETPPGDRFGAALGWNLHLLGSGGAAFPASVIDALHARGIRILQSYGATEAGGIGFDTEMTAENRNTLGYIKPGDGIAARIADGELHIKTDSLFSGYYKDPSATAAALVDGYFATGDLCTVTGDGTFTLVGRKSNVIVLSNGETVSPEAMEAALSCFDEILVYEENDRLAASIYSPHHTDGDLRRIIDAYNASHPSHRRIAVFHRSDVPHKRNQLGKLLRR